MAEHITRCPECSTSFRISESHLNSGKGSVRCGSCLNIFNARENLIAPKAPEPEPEPEIADDEDEDILISDTMQMNVDSSIASSSGVGEQFSEEFDDTFADTFRSKSATGEHEFNLFERDDSQKADDDDDVSQDESWALDLLNDDEEDKPSHDANEDTEDESNYSDDAYESDEDDSEYESSQREEPSYKNPFQIIDDEPLPEEDEPEPIDRYHAYDDVELEDPEEDKHQQTYAQPIHSTGSFTGTDYLAAIEPEPVEFSFQTSSDFWHSKRLWGSLTSVAGLLLVIQFAWIKFPTLSTIEPYRGYYAKVCSIMGCELPTLIDRSKIRSANLVVRSHPRIRGALVVDAVIQNTAKFEQSFPTLDLIFTDTRDQIVAARRLLPDDYLGGELAGRTTMPVKQPIHIALEITDPGEGATGYRIIIVN